MVRQPVVVVLLASLALLGSLFGSHERSGGGAFGRLWAGELSSLPSVDLAGADPVNPNPYGIAFHPFLPLAYVALGGQVAFPPDPPELFNGSTVVEIDLATLVVTRAFPVGRFPTELIVAPDGSELYVTNSSSASLSVVDLATEAITETLILDGSEQPVSFPSGIQISPDGEEPGDQV